MSANAFKRKKILYFGLDPERYHHQGTLSHLPLIATTALPFEHLKAHFSQLRSATHILFTSRTAIPPFFRYAQQAGFSTEQLLEKIYLSVGKSTTQLLQQNALQTIYTAHDECGEGVISLLETLPLKQAFLFFPHSASSRPLIETYLKNTQIPYIAFPLYETHPLQVDLPSLDDFDTLVFTSPSVVRAFFRLTKQIPPKEKCEAIGPITQKELDLYVS